MKKREIEYYACRWCGVVLDVSKIVFKEKQYLTEKYKVCPVCENNIELGEQ